VDLPFSCRSNGVETQQRSRRHDDLAARLTRKLNEFGSGQQGASAQHHHLLAGQEHGSTDFLEHRSRRGLYGQVRMNRKGWQRQDRKVDALIPHPRLGFGAITNRNSGQLEPRHANCQAAGEGSPNRS
jgi:hypothetical protein